MALINLLNVVQRLEDYRRKLTEATGAALYQEALAVMAVSQRQVPVDTGRLRATATVGGPVDTGNGPEVPLGYGTDYALYVHERTDMRHNAPTKAKFLEDPLRAAAVGFKERLAKRIKQNMANGVTMPVGGSEGTSE